MFGHSASLVFKSFHVFAFDGNFTKACLSFASQHPGAIDLLIEALNGTVALILPATMPVDNTTPPILNEEYACPMLDAFNISVHGCTTLTLSLNAYLMNALEESLRAYQPLKEPACSWPLMTTVAGGVLVSTLGLVGVGAFLSRKQRYQIPSEYLDEDLDLDVGPSANSKCC